MNNAVIRMMSYKNGWLSGRVTLNGREWVVKPFEIKKGASARDKENALLKQAIKEHGR